MLTDEIMGALWPKGNSHVPGLMDGIVAAAPEVLAKYGLTSQLTVAHAMAQFSHECGAGTKIVESIQYTPERACQVWDTRFQSAADCLAKVGCSADDPDFCTKLIDSVYGGRNGNRPGTRDGSTYIGRGLIQLTGRANYAALGAKLGLDLVNNPDLVNDPAHALECAVAEFVLFRHCLPFAEADDVEGVTQRINGAQKGIDERKAWLKRWKSALAGDIPPERSTESLQKSLNRLGAAPALDPDGNYGPATAHAVEAFQRAHKLEPDGKAGPATWDAIDAALAAL